MQAIGGYFELELCRNEHYHLDALRLNSGRHSLEYVLKSRNCYRVLIPQYSCDSLLEPVERLGIVFEYYKIDHKMFPEATPNMDANDAFLYINYFGLCDDHVIALSRVYGQQLIVDNTMAFFSTPVDDIDTFYSARKFFGVPDGAYLYTNIKLEEELEQDRSFESAKHLTKRIDLSPEDGYADFVENNSRIRETPLRTMSKLTERLLGSLNYDAAARRRSENYRILHRHLGHLNEMTLPDEPPLGPMAYPFLYRKEELRKKLHERRVFVPTYWPNVLKDASESSFEYKLARWVLPLPIDQRYGESDMLELLERMENEL